MSIDQSKVDGDQPYDLEYELELIKQAKLELPYSTSAYSLLMKSYEKRLYWMCRRIICDDSESQDAVQEVLIRVFHHLSSFKEESSFKTWLYAITRNVALTHYKKAKLLRESSPLMELNEGGENHAYNPHLKTDNAIDIDKVFNSMNVDDREILSLRFIADMALKEIAELLGIKLSTAKMRLARATERLKR